MADEEKTQEQQPQEVAPPATDAVVEAWFVETFHNIGLDTPLYNRFYDAKNKLKAQLAPLSAKKEE